MGQKGVYKRNESGVFIKGNRGYNIGKYVSQPFSNSYACYFLKSKGIKLFRGKERICVNDVVNKINKKAPSWPEEEFVYPSITTGVYKPSHYEKILTNLSLLNSLGVTISKNMDKSKHKDLHYFLTWIKDAQYPMKQWPTGHRVIYDVPFKTLALVGPLVRNKVNVFLLEPQYKDQKREEYLEQLSRQEQVNLLLGIPITREISKTKNIKIPELPIGFCREKHSVVCIPKSMNPPVILLIGKMGRGKTLCINFLQGMLRCHEGWQAKCAIINDVEFETDYWSQSMKTKLFLSQLKLINLKPRPSPIVYFSPHFGKEGLKQEKNLLLHEQGVHYTTVLDWKDVCVWYNDTFAKNEAMKLGKSGSFVDFEDFAQFKTEPELWDGLENIFGDENKRGRNTKEIYGRILRVLQRTLLRSGLTSMGNDVPPDFYVQFGEEESESMDAFSAALMAGLTPVLVTDELQNIKLGDEDATIPYSKFVIKNILRMKRLGYFPEDLVAIFIDELDQLLRRGAHEPIEELFTRSRKQGILPVAATHDYVELPDKLKRNTRYVFYFGRDLEEINQLKSRYLIDNFTLSELKNKTEVEDSKDIECFVFHDEKSPLILYDIYTGQRTEVDGIPVKIVPFPPMSNHKREKLAKTKFSGGMNDE